MWPALLLFVAAAATYSQAQETQLQCGPNEIEVSCKTVCPPQNCDISYTTYLCEDPIPCERGCDCIENYLRDTNGTCIPSEECLGPPYIPTCGVNEVEVDCMTVCPPQTCESINNTYDCEDSNECTPGCDCSDGFLRNADGACISSEDCFLNENPCGVNETYVTCNVGCPENNCPTSDSRDIIVCDPPNPCPAGCACRIGYRRISDEDPTCILAEDCEPVECTRPNEVWNSCPSACLAESCDDVDNQPTTCNTLIKNCQPKCVCQEGFFRNASDICVPAAQCPLPTCGDNEVAVTCKIVCPPQTCESIYTLYLCADSNECTPGCNCIDGYLRNSDGICIPSENCFSSTTSPPGVVCPANETYAECQIGCPTNYCPMSDARALVACLPQFPCPPGCVCANGYKRRSWEDPVCIAPQDCPPVPCTRPNEEWNSCPRSCQEEYCDPANIPSAFCNQNNRVCAPNCVCKSGFRRNSTDICIPADECPPSEITTPPPAENRCSVNETYVQCNVGCPDNNCPTSDSRDIIACDPPYPCPPGCACRVGYRRISDEDPTCILAEECEPVECTRPNEVWDSCPSACLAESCEDVNNQPTTCNTLIKNCQPKCVCQKGFFRNASDICVPAAQCQANLPTCGVNEVAVPCKIICPPQTCESIYTLYRCADIYNCTPGCNCIDGYLRNSEGVCILSENCSTSPPSEVCPANETYARCQFECPANYCPTSDTRAILACTPPFPCPPGCVCAKSYKRRSRDDPTCIAPEECPPVNCTRPNEEWDSCPPPCQDEYCELTNNPSTFCNQNNRVCAPKCVCKSGFRRNNSDICIPTNQCPPPEVTTVPPVENSCGENETYVQCSFGCPYNNCPTSDSRILTVCSPPFECSPGCACKVGYKRVSDEDPTCILGEECEPVKCSRPNEVWDSCPSACLAESCEDVNNEPITCNTLIKNCQPKCVCQEGFFRNASDICIPAAKCDESLCGANGTYSECGFKCPNQYCPQDDSLFKIACKPPRDCPSGCQCKPNYKRKSYDDETCILASDCPPVTCTRPNEEWSPCPSSCLSERCQDVNNPPTACDDLMYDCEPQCTCKDGFCRDDSDTCVPINRCRM